MTTFTLGLCIGLLAACLLFALGVAYQRWQHAWRIMALEREASTMTEQMQEANEMLESALAALMEQRESAAMPLIVQPIKERKH